jgi:origin recognition complex subunit 5
MSQRLVGPRAFDLERMIAIFHSITNYEVKQTVDIQMQVPTPPSRDGADEIATLGTLKLILRANRGDPLTGGGRWKVNVAEEEVRRIAGSVGFSLNDHMVD